MQVKLNRKTGRTIAGF